MATRRTKIVLTLTSTALLLGISIGAYLLWSQASKTSDSAQTLPAKTVKSVSGFKVYYFKPGYSTDFKLEESSISYRNGTLLFSMRNSAGQQLIFTEVATPVNFDTSTLKSDKEFDTSYGRAYITDGETRTTGALFTKDKTWILINAPSPIGGDSMRSIISNLSPLQY